MRFNFIGYNDSYGKHRFSNNHILELLSEHTESNEELNFVWWIEKVFTDPKYANDLQILLKKPWFGVAHVPLLTPNWAMYSQNDLSRIYLSSNWKEAKKNCKGIICFSEYMAQQFKAFEPDLNVYSLKHPVGRSSRLFDVSAFMESPQLVLVGTWLRDYKWFFESEFGLDKKVLMTHYTESYLNKTYINYFPQINEYMSKANLIDRLDDFNYDLLLSRSLIFLGLHETSANNALCECMVMNVPFIANRHPAIVEYVGADYPLFVNSGKSVKIDKNIVKDAHDYLKINKEKKMLLSYDCFLNGFFKIYKDIVDFG